jgi:murein L,D-transpeptidase YcbB/YkuD
VKAFQKANGLKADGVAGAKTQNVIYGDVLGSPAPVVTPTPSPTKKP